MQIAHIKIRMQDGWSCAPKNGPWVHNAQLLTAVEPILNLSCMRSRESIISTFQVQPVSVDFGSARAGRVSLGSAVASCKLNLCIAKYNS